MDKRIKGLEKSLDTKTKKIATQLLDFDIGISKDLEIFPLDELSDDDYQEYLYIISNNYVEKS